MITRTEQPSPITKKKKEVIPAKTRRETVLKAGQSGAGEVKIPAVRNGNLNSTLWCPDLVEMYSAVTPPELFVLPYSVPASNLLIGLSPTKDVSRGRV